MELKPTDHERKVVELLETRARISTDSPSTRTLERAHAFHLLAGFIRYRDLAKNVRDDGNEHLAKQMDDASWMLVRETEPVRLSLAQEALGVSNPTVRFWTDQGLLEDFGGKPKRVGLDGIARVLEILVRLRLSGQEHDLLAAVLSEIEREELLTDARFRKSLDEMRRGERAAV